MGPNILIIIKINFKFSSDIDNHFSYPVLGSLVFLLWTTWIIWLSNCSTCPM